METFSFQTLKVSFTFFPEGTIGHRTHRSQKYRKGHPNLKFVEDELVIRLNDGKIFFPDIEG